MLVEWYVARTNQIVTLGYVSRTNYITAFAYLEQITTFRVCVWHKSDCRIRVYISHSHITAKGYLGPVTSFGNCFLANDLMELGGCTQRIEKKTVIFGLNYKFNGLWPSREPRRVRSRFI